MNIKSLYPRYALSRIQQIAFCRTFPDAPWLTASAIRLLDSWLKSGDVGIEWGSGRSTIWFATRVGKLLSVEHDKQWFDRVAQILRDKKLADKVDYRFVSCLQHEIDEPLSADYASAAESYADNSVDFALVDGTIRATCMLVAMRKIKSGGLLILDNANRFLPNLSLGKHSTTHEPRSDFRTPQWAQIAASLKPWRAILTSDNIWNTRFWVKPCD